MSNHIESNVATFRALEALPIELYWEICFAARVWDAVDVLRLYRQTARMNGPEAAIRSTQGAIWAGDESDILSFAMQYRDRYGVGWPHYDAGATVLTYQEPVGVKMMRLPPWASPSVKAAWRSAEKLLPR